MLANRCCCSLQRMVVVGTTLLNHFISYNVMRQPVSARRSSARHFAHLCPPDQQFKSFPVQPNSRDGKGALVSIWAFVLLTVEQCVQSRSTVQNLPPVSPSVIRWRLISTFLLICSVWCVFDLESLCQTTPVYLMCAGCVHTVGRFGGECNTAVC